MLPLRNDGAGLTVRMKLNLPVGFPYCCGPLMMLLARSCRSAFSESGVVVHVTSFRRRCLLLSQQLKGAVEVCRMLLYLGHNHLVRWVRLMGLFVSMS